MTSDVDKEALLAVRHVLMMPGGQHVYVSTACLHNEHEKCRISCKFCESRCVCPDCHGTPGNSSPLNSADN